MTAPPSAGSRSSTRSAAEPIVKEQGLQRAHDENPIFHGVPTLSLWDGLRAVRLKLWDEDGRRLVTFAEARAGLPPQRAPHQHQVADPISPR
jgi:hypothetical protein